MNAERQTYKCFGCGVRGDVFAWQMHATGCTFPEAVRSLATAAGVTLPTATQRTAAREVGRKSWKILDVAGREVAEHVRIDRDDGKKDFVWRRNGLDGLRGMACADVPLYGVEDVAGRPDETVVVTEGEKAADALRIRRILAVGTVTGAASCPSAATLEPLRGRHVILWPDADTRGHSHMTKVGMALGPIAASVRVATDPDANDGDDAADLAAYEDSVVCGILDAAVPFPGPLAPTEPEAPPASERSTTTSSEADAVRRAADFARTLASSNKPGALAVLEKHVAGLRTAFEAPTEPAGWGWADPMALLDEPEAPIRWYVHNLLAPGHVTSLNASPKCGKTTTVTRGILGPLSRGEAPFCGTVPDEPVLALWLTEESRRGARNHVRYGGIRGGAVLPRPGPPASVPWPSVVEGAADHARKIGARILVFDTFARHARLKGDEENSASAVGEAMEPVLRVAATHDLAVLLIHHVKKWASRTSNGGDVDLARGSGAFNANVDFYANLIKPENRKPGQERYRELYGAGRDGVEDYKLTLDLLRGDGVTTFDHYRIVGVDEAARDDALDADVFDLVRESGENGITKAEIIDQVERRTSDVVASLARLCKGSPPKIRRGKAAKGEKAPRFRLWVGGVS